MHRLLAALRRIMEPTIPQPRTVSLPRSSFRRKTKMLIPTASLRKSQTPAFFTDKCTSDTNLTENFTEQKVTEKTSEIITTIIDENFCDCREDISS